MPGIICAIRGGPHSRPTIEKAIELARETGLPLFFLYVVNLDFLTHSSSSRTHVISKELHQMGDFILLSAQETAEAEGVSSEGVVRHGSIGDEIVTLARERKADYVVLGRPQGQEEEDVFTRELLKRFSQRIEEESGAQVVLPEGLHE